MPRAKPKKSIASFRFQHIRLSKGLKQELLEITQLDETKKLSLEEGLINQVEEALSNYLSYSPLSLPRPANRRAELQLCTPLLGEAAKVLKDLSPFAKADLFLSPLPPSKKRSLSKILQRLPGLVDDLQTLHLTANTAIEILSNKPSRQATPKIARTELIKTLCTIFDEVFQKNDENRSDIKQLQTDFIKNILKAYQISVPRKLSSLLPSSN